MDDEIIINPFNSHSPSRNRVVNLQQNKESEKIRESNMQTKNTNDSTNGNPTTKQVKVNGDTNGLIKDSNIIVSSAPISLYKTSSPKNDTIKKSENTRTYVNALYDFTGAANDKDQLDMYVTHEFYFLFLDEILYLTFYLSKTNFTIHVCRPDTYFIGKKSYERWLGGSCH